MKWKTILKTCEIHKDELGEIISTHVTTYTEFVSKEAKYHLDCYSEF